MTAGALAACLATVAACADNDATAVQPTAAASGAAENPGGGTVPPGQPDVNGDGKVVVGVLSPGDINDKGYYQSFVDAAEAFAQQQGWTVIKRGSVNPSEALTAARALCQQKVDLVALGASELKDAIPASEEPVCEKTAWYVPSSENIQLTPKIMLSTDIPDQSMLAAGYAAGLLLKEKGATKAGFVTGPEVDFTTTAVKGFRAGLRLVIPEAELVVTYTGDLNDSAKAKEATQAQLSQGAKLIYPYLGGSADASAQLADEAGAITLTPGTDRCGTDGPKYDISVLYSPGDYFKAALEDFAAAKFTVGINRVWKMGVDPYPTVKYCSAGDEQTKALEQFIADMGSGKIDFEAEVQRLGS